MAFQPFKNVGSQVLEVFAFDYTTGAPKTGDAANITAYVTIDGGSVTVLGDTSATEKSSTNAPGWYQFDLAQGETNGDHLLYTAKSSTGNVTVVGMDTNSRPSAFGLVGGATGGVLIAGTNAATTFSGLTTGALSITTLTASGAVAFQSTFAVTGTTTLTGAVSLGSTLGVTGTTTFAAINTGAIGATTFATSGTMTLNALTVSNATTLTGAVSLGSTLGVTGAITANNAGNAITGVTASVTGDFTATMKTSIGTAVAASAVASVTGNVGGNVVGSVVGSVGSVTAAITLPTIPTNWITADGLATDAVNEVADGFLNRNMATGTDSGSDTVRTPRQALRAMRNKWVIATGTLTVYKEDDTTSSWTSALTGTAGADPITTSDPAGP